MSALCAPTRTPVTCDDAPAIARDPRGVPCRDVLHAVNPSAAGLGCPAAAAAVAEGWVHSWDISTGVDGPGTRLVIFLSGCPLRCLYCQNPDTWRRSSGGRLTRLEDLTRRMAHYEPFITAAGGGLTVSGGEPLQQPAFTRELLAAAQRLGLHTALDTSGFLGRRADRALLEATDLVLLDVKAGTDAAHRALTGRPIGPTLSFARRLSRLAAPTWVRYVLVPGYNDSAPEVDAFIGTVARLRNVSRVEILPFHKLGAPKYGLLGIGFPLAEHPVASPDLVSEVRERMLHGGLAVV